MALSSHVENPAPLIGSPRVAYSTNYGTMLIGSAGDILASKFVRKLRGRVQLIFTSPPFPLNRKKRYGNLNGQSYIDWLSGFAGPLRDLLKPNGSIVIELGNAWESGKPAMSTLPIEALLAFLKSGDLTLCQMFICYNRARLPGPAQWVNVERIRVKDAFTHLWWMSPTDRPKADNRRVLNQYSESMQRLLVNKKYNAGSRPSEHRIGDKSFLVNHNGAIPPNVLTVTNTSSSDRYQEYCRKQGLPIHPARMPAHLARFFIRFLTSRKDFVLDPFAGSNTTGSVAEELGRRWISIEANDDYVRGSRGRFGSFNKRGSN